MASCITIPLKFCIPIPIKLSRIPPLAKFLFQCIELQHSFLAAMIENTTEIYLGSHPSLLSQRTSAFLDFLSLWNANKSVEQTWKTLQTPWKCIETAFFSARYKSRTKLFDGLGPTLTSNPNPKSKLNPKQTSDLVRPLY